MQKVLSGADDSDRLDSDNDSPMVRRRAALETVQ